MTQLLESDMHNAFNKMLDILNNSDDSEEENIEDVDYNADLQIVMEQIRELEAPNVDIAIRREMIEVIEFDPKNNVLDLNVRDDFKNECVFEETDIFSKPVSTTTTMEGFLSNVRFHEQELIQELMADDQLVMYRCNYGKVKYGGYTEPIKERKTNRGRKKKAKKKKLRKKQGDGVDFNSQITFVARSEMNNPMVGIPYGTKVYKFKVFRTGKIQLPGGHQHLIDDVVMSAKKIAQILNFHLHPAELNPAKITNVININPVMKNYKFIVKILPGYIIDLNVLKSVLFAEMVRHSDDEMTHSPEHPAVFTLGYTRQDTKLSIIFTTPVYKKPKKKTRVNIFMRGKINILGAFYACVTRQICEYLHWIFEHHYDMIVVREGVSDCTAFEYHWVENIEQFDDGEVDTIIYGYINWMPELPFITDEEFEIALKFISDTYDEEMSAANAYLLEYFDGTFVGDFIR